MDLTIKDVIAHPAIKSTVFTKSKFEIERMRDILRVLQLYDEIQALYKMYKFTELTTAGHTDGFLHFKECAWVCGNEGPDTCGCCYVKIKCKEILGILDKFNLDVENGRLETFTMQWPHLSPTPEELASAGFYYFGNSDIVRCGFCNVEIGKWEKDDNPMILHKKWSPLCPHVKRRRMNVSI